MIKWCENNSVYRILFASSFVVYGDNLEQPRAIENDHCNPKSIYALSKYYCERLLEIYAQPRGINWNILRMFNVFGPGQDMSRDDQGMVSIFLKIVKDSDFVGVQGRLDRFRDFISWLFYFTGLFNYSICGYNYSGTYNGLCSYTFLDDFSGLF